MRKGIILCLLMGMFIGGFTVKDNREVSSTLSNYVSGATNYLEVRPNSNKSNNQLTRTQLISFLGTVTTEVHSRVDGLYDIDQVYVTQRLADLTALIEGVTDAQFASETELYYSLYESLFELYSYVVESRAVEGRGIWQCPFESNLEEVRVTLEKLSEMGINMLYVETFWLGRLIYNSQIPGTHQHYFTLNGYRDDTVDYGTNLLLAFTEEGKKYGIEVHAWVENFFVGYGASYTNSPILKENPDWAGYNYDGTIPQKSEYNYIFMDPANPEVRDYVKAIYVEIASTVDIASIHLDYIRYPVARNTTSPASSNLDTGYSVYAEKEFKMLYGYTGDLRELVITNPQAAMDWKEYKKNVISDFVAGVYYMVKLNNPDVYLSTAIFGNLNSALDTKMQDWASWIEDGYVEMILPMAYYQSSITVKNEVRNLTNLVDENAFSYAGIAPSFMGYNDHLNTIQIEGSLDGDAMGATFFASQNYLVRNVDGVNSFNTKVQGILKNGAFRNEAILPHGDTKTVVDKMFDEIIGKMDRLYIPASKMNETDKANLETEIARLKTYNVTTKQDIETLLSELDGFDATNYALAPASTRMTEDIEYLKEILRIKVKRYNFDETIDTSVNPDPNYYFPEPELLTIPQNIVLTDYTLTWDSVPGTSKYTVRVNGEEYLVDGLTFDIRTSFLVEGTNAISVKAQGDDVYTTSSDFGIVTNFEVRTLDTPSNLHIINDILYFDPVDQAVSYEVRIGFYIRETTETKYNLLESGVGDRSYNISVKAIGNNYTTIESDYSTTVSYIYGDESLLNTFLPLFTEYTKENTKQE